MLVFGVLGPCEADFFYKQPLVDPAEEQCESILWRPRQCHMFLSATHRSYADHTQETWRMHLGTSWVQAEPQVNPKCLLLVFKTYFLSWRLSLSNGFLSEQTISCLYQDSFHFSGDQTCLCATLEWEYVRLSGVNGALMKQDWSWFSKRWLSSYFREKLYMWSHWYK